MKLNEKTLIYFSTSNTPKDKEGWLFKRGELNKSFQKRWFVLKGNLLFYFERSNDKEPIGVIILEGCTVELAEEETDIFAFKLVFHGEGCRTYILATDEQDCLEEWMKLVACASYDYMKLMVLELNHQLAELDQAERLSDIQTRQGQSSQGGRMPVAPPRTRQNPFNKGTLVAKTKTFSTLHQDFGIQISKDRSNWLELGRINLIK